MEEGYTWREALVKIVKLVGVKEYAQMIGLEPSNLINQMEGNITINTLDKMIRPIDVEISFTDKKHRGTRKVAALNKVPQHS